MIITGGIGLYLDALLNIVLMTMSEDSKKLKCFISIITTMTVHYLGYLSLVFRAQRVFKVLRLEKKYLDEIYNMASDSKFIKTESKKSNDTSSASLSLKVKSMDNSSKHLSVGKEMLLDPEVFSDNS